MDAMDAFAAVRRRFQAVSLGRGGSGPMTGPRAVIARLDPLRDPREAARDLAASSSFVTIPLALDHQLYAASPCDRTELDRQFANLVRDGTLLRLRLPSLNGVAYVSTSDYCLMLGSLGGREDEPLRTRLDRLLRFDGRARDALLFGLPEKELEALFRDPEAAAAEAAPRTSHVTTLARLGLLVRADVDVVVTHDNVTRAMAGRHCLSVPHAGAFLGEYSKGNGEVVRIVQRRPLGEIPEEMLLKKRLRQSRLGVEYHLADLIAIHSLRRIETSAGPMIRMGAGSTS